MKFPLDDPTKFEPISMWNNKLTIDDVSVNILRGIDKYTGKKYKELVIGYKTIYINTYRVEIYDMSKKNQDNSMLYAHESFHIWESPIKSLLINKNKNYITFSKAGINVLSIGSVANKRIVDSEG